MSRRIPDWDGPGTGFVILSAVACVDTVAFFSRRPLPPGVLGSLRREYRKNLIVEELSRPRNLGPRIPPWWLITIHQPKRATLKTLAQIQCGNFVVSQVHVAVDFTCSNPGQAALAVQYLKRRCVQKWRANRLFNLEYGYWGRQGTRRNIASYVRRSKVSLRPAAHHEFRFTGAAACKRAGVASLPELIHGLDAMKLLERQVKLMFIDLARYDRVIEKMACRQMRIRQKRRGNNMDVREIKSRLRRLVSHILCSNEGSRNCTIEKAHSQGLLDELPRLRACTKGELRQLRACFTKVEWSAFTPSPTWHHW
jgi:hypothetical protein